MGFARYLQNKQIDLDGIDQYSPDLDIIDDTMNSIQTGYDTTQALANTLPEHLDGDSEGMRALQEEYALEMENIRDGFATDASLGNSMLKEFNSRIAKDFGPTGKAYRAGKRYQDVNKFKEAVFASKMPLDYAQSFLDKHSSKSAFDKDGNYVSWEPPASMPTIPNFSEIMLNAGKEILPETTSIDSVEMDENGDWVAIITKEGVKRTKEEIKAVLTSLAGGVPDITGAINEFGDPAIKGLDDAIEGVMAAKYQNDSTLKIKPVSAGKGGVANKDSKGKVVLQKDPDIVGSIDYMDTQSLSNELFQRDEDGNIPTNENGEVIAKILDHTKSDDQDEINENINRNLENTSNIAKDIIAVNGPELHNRFLGQAYNSTVNYSNTNKIIQEKPSEAFRDGTPARKEALEEYVLFKLATDFTNETDLYNENFNEDTSVEEVKSYIDDKLKNYTEEEKTALFATYDQVEINREFNRKLYTQDKAIEGRNRAVRKSQVIDRDTEELFTENLNPFYKKLYEGNEYISEEEKARAYYEYGQSPVSKLLDPDSKVAYQLKIEEQTALLDAMNAQIEKQNDILQDNNSSPKDLYQAQNRLTRYERELGNIETEITKLTVAKKQAPAITKDVENWVDEQAKIIQNPENRDKINARRKAIESAFDPNVTSALFTFRDTVDISTGDQTIPKSNSKLAGAALAENNFFERIAPKKVGTGVNAKYKKNTLFDQSTYYDPVTGEKIAIEDLTNVVGIEKEGLIQDSGYAYGAAGILQKVDKNGKLIIEHPPKRVIIKNKQLDLKIRDALYTAGNPLDYIKITENFVDQLDYNPKDPPVDSAVLGNMFSVKATQESDGQRYLYIYDDIAANEDSNEEGFVSKYPFKDSYEAAEILNSINKGNQAVSYDKELDIKSLVSRESGFSNPNISFSNNVERKAGNKEFVEDFEESFGSLEVPVIVTSMLRSSENQKRLNKQYGRPDRKDLISGHLYGEGIDVSYTTELANAMKNKGFDIEKAKEKYVEFEGLLVYIHGTKADKDGNRIQGLHFDIKKKK